jgi:hypothetical protein
MSVSIILRLLPDHLVEGRLVGVAEVVATGTTGPFRSSDELPAVLAALIHQQGLHQQGPPGEP